MPRDDEVVKRRRKRFASPAGFLYLYLYLYLYLLPQQVSSPAETSVVGSGRRTSAATSLPSGGTTTATLTSNANSKVVAKEPAQAGKVGGKLVSAQDPFSQQNFKQYGAGPLPSQHISPQMGGSRQAPSLSPHSPLTSSTSAQRSPHSSSTLQVPFHCQPPHYQQALIGPAWRS